MNFNLLRLFFARVLISRLVSHRKTRGKPQASETLKFSYFATPFLQRFGAGAKKSFAYLEKDTQSLCVGEIAEFKGILLCAKNESLIAKAIKQKGVVLSAKQRKEMMKGDSVVSGRIGVVFMGERALIFEYEKCEKIPKKFKENYRKARIAK